MTKKNDMHILLIKYMLSTMFDERWNDTYFYLGGLENIINEEYEEYEECEEYNDDYLNFYEEIADYYDSYFDDYNDY